MRRRTPLVGLLLILAAPLAGQARDPWAAIGGARTMTPRPTRGEITLQDLQSRLYGFAADSMEGRILGSRGNVKGTDYIASELRRLGLEPAGENGTYFQTLPLVDRSLDTTGTLAVGGTSWRAWGDFVPRDQGPGSRSIDGVPVVYGGDFADTATRISPDAARGKLVVLTFSATTPGNPPGIPNRGQVNQRYAGAAGIAVVAREQLLPEQMAAYRQPTTLVLFDGPPELPTYLYISRPMADAIFGGPLGAVRPGAEGRVLSGAVKWTNAPSPFPARNVIGIVRGSDPTLRNEYVAVGAHNDHVGMGEPVAHDSIYVVDHLYRQQGADDAPVGDLTPAQATEVNAALAQIRRATNGASSRADSIYNGADDDGSGSMGVLEIAERFATQREKPKRSVLFIWHVGEEAGLFGSQWFTDHPTVPRESIIAELNVDMIGRGAPTDITGVTKEGAKINGSPDYLQVIGSRRTATQLGDLVEQVNREGRHGLVFDYALDANGHPQNIFCRSDHYMYARYGIPIAFFTTGGHADYHQVTDEAQYIEWPHYLRVTKFIADLAMRTANLPQRPTVDHPLPDPRGRCQQ
jgi:peptidase M28-like protein